MGKREILRLDDTSKVYNPNRRTEVDVLEGLSFSLEEGDFVAITGTSGSGKTTLLNIIAGLDKPTGGEVIFEGQNITEMNDRLRTSLRAEKIGFIFQEPTLLPGLNAEENVRVGLSLAKPDTKRQIQKERSMAALDVVGLSDRSEHYPYQLSGGEQQRVAIARAIVKEPELILADEPTGSLDPGSKLQIMEALKLVNDLGNTLVVVTHDEATAEYAHKSFELIDGRLVPTQQPLSSTAEPNMIPETYYEQ